MKKQCFILIMIILIFYLLDMELNGSKLEGSKRKNNVIILYKFNLFLFFDFI